MSFAELNKGYNSEVLLTLILGSHEIMEFFDVVSDHQETKKRCHPVRFNYVAQNEMEG
jgi:hypothetical protein